MTKQGLEHLLRYGGGRPKWLTWLSDVCSGLHQDLHIWSAAAICQNWNAFGYLARGSKDELGILRIPDRVLNIQTQHFQRVLKDCSNIQGPWGMPKTSQHHDQQDDGPRLISHNPRENLVTAYHSHPGDRVCVSASLQECFQHPWAAPAVHHHHVQGRQSSNDSHLRHGFQLGRIHLRLVASGCHDFRWNMPPLHSKNYVIAIADHPKYTGTLVKHIMNLSLHEFATS